MPFEYDAQILETLAGHGLVPLPTTTPERLRDALRDLYRYEIRELRQSLLAGRIERRNYADHVIQLRKRYWLLSLPLQHWAKRAAG